MQKQLLKSRRACERLPPHTSPKMVLDESSKTLLSQPQQIGRDVAAHCQELAEVPHYASQLSFEPQDHDQQNGSHSWQSLPCLPQGTYCLVSSTITLYHEMSIRASDIHNIWSDFLAFWTWLIGGIASVSMSKHGEFRRRETWHLKKPRFFKEKFKPIWSLPKNPLACGCAASKSKLALDSLTMMFW